VGELLVYAKLSETSVSEPINWRTIGVWTGLYAFLCAWFLSVGMLLSFLRRWAFLLIGIVVWVLFLLVQLRVPFVDYLNPLGLGEAVFVDGEWVVPWAHLAVLSVTGVLALAGALGVFSMRDNRLTKLREWMDETVWGGVLKWAVLVMIALVWLGFLINFTWVNFDSMWTESDRLTDELEERMVEAGAVFEHQTGRYAFTYRERDADRVRVLLERGDEAYDEVAELLGAEAFEGRVVVDLARPIAEHNAGQAYWKKIRMSIGEGDTEDEVLGVLGHETVHVFLEQLSEGRISEVFGSTRWFHEGVATYLQYRYFLPVENVGEMDRWLAVASAWGQVEFEEMVGDEVLVEKRDGNLVYPAGRLWVEALVEVHAEGAIGQLTRAMARDGAPRKLNGLGLWRDLFQACGYNLERVLAEFRRKLRALEERESELVAGLPTLEGKAERAGGWVEITPEYEGVAMEGATLWCRVKPSQDAAFYEVEDVRIGDDGKFTVRGLHFRKPTVWLQMGWRVEGMYSPVFGEWREVVVE
ncbi:MAG: hypothetical protein P8J87_01215, partial [Verrucomicrobiales bacterium]|nr:hypothetical protein [Verrucomicrobiales bacterium]